MNKRKVERFIIAEQQKANFIDLLSDLMTMFDHKNIPFKREFIEWHLLKFGYVALCRHNGTVYCGFITTYDFDEYGLPKEGGKATFMTRFGFTVDGVIGDDILIGYNKESRTPEFTDYYAKMFGEVDLSMLTNVTKARVNPIPVARDEKQKKAIDKAMIDTENGKTSTIVSENALSDFVDGDKGIKTVSVTEPNQIERIQYLSKFYDDLLRRFWTRYGHSLSSASKMAQVSTEELQGYETLSMIRPYDMLQARKKLYDMANEKWNTDFSIDFSEPWQHLKHVNENVSSETNSEESEVNTNETE